MPVRQREIPQDFIYMWNKKNETDEKTKQKQTHREQMMVAREEGYGGVCKIGKGEWEIQVSNCGINKS